MRTKMILATVAVATCVICSARAEALTRVWTGESGDGLASTAENWSPSGTPVSGDAIVLNARGNGHPMRWDAAMKGVSPASWTQDGYTESVTFETVYDAEGFDKVMIAGDVSLMSGSWTHLGNVLSALYRLFVEVGGKMTVGADAVITAEGLGFYSQQPIAKLYGGDGAGTQGGTHGGRGAKNDNATGFTTRLDPYGYCYAPEMLGTGGNWMGDLNGGGAIRLIVNGKLTLEGTVCADGIRNTVGNYYSGSGGSIWITAESIAGAGRLTANAKPTETSGSGGRIAVTLTGENADFSEFDLVRQAEAFSQQVNSDSGGAVGTIYGETVADGAGHGWLILKAKDGAKVPSSSLRYGDPFSYEVKEIGFSHVTLTNNVRMRVGAGCTLHVADTVFDTADKSGVVNALVADGGTIDFGEGKTVIGCPCIFSEKQTFPSGLEIAAGVTVTANGGLVVMGDMTVRSGASVTCDGPFETPIPLEVSVSGKLTIDEGGSIDVAGKGYPKGVSPVPQALEASWCASSHGGQGWWIGNDSTVVPYGSIRNPLTPGGGTICGSSGTGFAGGGVAILRVGGALVNNGYIGARSLNGAVSGGTQGVGPGGSINITAGTLSGSGSIDASSHDRAACCGANAVSGGGRIAVTLTDVGADFTDFSTDRIVAYGGSSGSRTGGAGTVYLRKAGQGLGNGTLIVRNLSSGSANEVMKPTVIGGYVTDDEFGSVEISGGAILSLADNMKITVNGDWRNAASFVGGTGSSVTFAGTGSSVYEGTTTFVNVGCTTPGKVICFAKDAVLAVTGVASFSGGDKSMVSLVSETEGAKWSVDTAEALMSAVAIRDCVSLNAFDIIDGEDLGGNSDNITFKKSQPADTLTWTGTEGSSWTVGGNWDKDRAPSAIDTVVIPVGCAHYPILGASVSMAALTIQKGASLELGAVTLAVTGAAKIDGRVSSSVAGVLELRADLDAVTGVVALPAGQLVLNAAVEQTVACGDASFGSIAVKCPSVILDGRFVFSTFAVGNGSSAFSIAFGDGTSVDAHDFLASGNAETMNVTLCCVRDGGVWSLNTLKSSVTGATVSGSDASAGMAIIPISSASVGSLNRNWLFTDTRFHWNGTDTVPEGSDVVIDDGVSATLGVESRWGSLTLSQGGALKVNAPLSLSSSVSVDQDATLTLNRPVTVAGNFLMFSGAELTHDANADERVNAIELTVGGDAIVESGARIDLVGKGYGLGKGSGASLSGEAGGSYGGCGYLGSAQSSVPGYGSLIWPMDLGSGGTRSPGCGGGAVKLVINGTLTVDGEIASDGSATDPAAPEGFYTGSGGSIAIKAAALTGQGYIHADGGMGSRSFLGGGGRIAIIQTVATRDGFTGQVHAFGGGHSTANFDGSAGTVYREDASMERGCGILTVANSATKLSTTDFDKSDRTDFPGAENPSETKHVTVRVKSNGTLYLTRDATVQDIVLEDTTARIKLNGHTLSVLAKRHQVSPNDATQIIADGGEIKFVRGLLIFVK